MDKPTENNMLVELTPIVTSRIRHGSKGNVKVFLDKLSNKLKIKIGKNIGSGWFGYAYALPGNKVLKLTADGTEYLNAKKLIGEKWNHIVNVYGAYALKEPYDGVYAIIMERIKQPPNLGAMMDNLLKHINIITNKPNKFNKDGSYSYFSEIIYQYGEGKISDEQINYYKSELKEIDPKLEKLFTQVLSMAAELSANDITAIQDIHGDNVGIKNGKLALLDIGSVDEDIETEKDLELTENKVDESEVDSVLHNLETNINSFVKKLAKSLKIQPKKIKQLGQGGYAYAFSVPGNKVLKVTSDYSDFVHATNLVGKNNKHIVNVYETYKIDEPYEDVFVIISEKLIQNNSIGKFEDALYDVIEEYSNIKNFPWESIHQMIDDVEVSGSKKYLKDINNIGKNLPSQFSNIYKQFIGMLDAIHENGINVDFHSGNLGFKTNGNLALLDFGDNSDVEFSNKPKTLSINELTHKLTNNKIGETKVTGMLRRLDDNMESFVQKVAKILKIQPKKIKQLGRGGYGYAFEIPGNKVMKVTADVSEYINALELKGRNNKHIVNVYDVYEIAEPYIDVYVIISEKLKQDKSIQSGMNDIYGWFHDVKERSGFPWEYVSDFVNDIMDDGVKKYSKVINQMLKDINPKSNDFSKQLINVLMDASKNNINIDFHDENFGYKSNGNLALLDLGIGKDGDIDIPQHKRSVLSINELTHKLTNNKNPHKYVGVEDKDNLVPLDVIKGVLRYHYDNTDPIHMKLNKIPQNVLNNLKRDSIKYVKRHSKDGLLYRGIRLDEKLDTTKVFTLGDKGLYRSWTVDEATAKAFSDARYENGILLKFPINELDVIMSMDVFLDYYVTDEQYQQLDEYEQDIFDNYTSEFEVIVGTEPLKMIYGKTYDIIHHNIKEQQLEENKKPNDIVKFLKDKKFKNPKSKMFLYHGTKINPKDFNLRDDYNGEDGNTWSGDLPEGYLFLTNDINEAKAYGQYVIPFELERYDHRFFKVNSDNPSKVFDMDYGIDLEMPKEYFNIWGQYEESGKTILVIKGNRNKWTIISPIDNVIPRIDLANEFYNNKELEVGQLNELKKKDVYKPKGQAAGCLIFAKDTGRFLLLKRSEGDKLGTWGIVGGGIDKGENRLKALHREIGEEIPNIKGVKLGDLTMVFKNKVNDNFEYFNYIGKVDREFTPELNYEHSKFQWCDKNDIPENLHPGVQALLIKLGILDKDEYQKDLLNEDFQSTKEIRKLSGDIIKLLADKNLDNVNQNLNDKIKFNSVKLSDINPSSYIKLNQFIQNYNLSIELVENITNLYKGNYASFIKERGVTRAGDIELYYHDNLIDSLKDELKYTNGKIDNLRLYSIFYFKFANNLMHELQHVYDDYRSLGKALKSQDVYDTKYNKASSNSKIINLQQAKDYLNLPHEIWARFTQAIDRIYFYSLDFNDKGVVYEMYPMEKVAKEFKKQFKGFDILTDDMKRRLIKAVIQFWHFEQDDLKKDGKLNENNLLANNNYIDIPEAKLKYWEMVFKKYPGNMSTYALQIISSIKKNHNKATPKQNMYIQKALRGDNNWGNKN